MSSVTGDHGVIVDESTIATEGAAEAPRGILRVLWLIRRAIERISDFTGTLAWMLAWVVFFIGFFNVITRYLSKLVGEDFIYGPAFDYWWMSFGFMFLLAMGHGLREGVNPRIDFWWADFSEKRKAILDLSLHVLLMVPYMFFALTALWPYMLTALGKKRTGDWREVDGIRFWEIWEAGPDAGNLTRGPIKSMLFFGVAMLGLQFVAEIIKQIFILVGRKDLTGVAERDGILRIE